jgi:hypothetical protein
MTNGTTRFPITVQKWRYRKLANSGRVVGHSENGPTSESKMPRTSVRVARNAPAGSIERSDSHGAVAKLLNAEVPCERGHP